MRRLLVWLTQWSGSERSGRLWSLAFDDDGRSMEPTIAGLAFQRHFYF